MESLLALGKSLNLDSLCDKMDSFCLNSDVYKELDDVDNSSQDQNNPSSLEPVQQLDTHEKIKDPPSNEQHQQQPQQKKTKTEDALES